MTKERVHEYIYKMNKICDLENKQKPVKTFLQFGFGADKPYLYIGGRHIEIPEQSAMDILKQLDEQIDIALAEAKKAFAEMT